MQWIKVIHILAVMGWMTGIFAVPRALIYWKREFEKSGSGSEVATLTIRIYRFSSLLGVIAIAAGLWLAYEFGFPVWTHMKIAAVTLLALHYAYTGILVKRAYQGIFDKSDRFLRVFNEISVLVVIAILYLVVFKPF